MNLVRVLLLGLAISLPAVCSAQWRWVDKNGRTVFSDQPPPADIPAANVVGQPRAQKARSEGTAPPAAAASVPAGAVQPAKLPASAGRLGGKDQELQARKKQAEAAEAEKREAQEQEAAALRAENCLRAKRSKAGFDSGARIARTNDKGEREYLDDAARAAEVKRLQSIIARDCAPTGG